MSQSRVTIRYAKALLELAIENNTLDQSYNDMLLIKNICLQNKDFTLLLKSPIVKTDQKLKILELIFDRKLAEMSMLFIKIITNKKRESLLNAIADSFISLYKTHNKIATATVTTAYQLDEELKQEVLKIINKETNNKIELKEIIDEKIIGGAIIRIGDKQLDASVSKAIAELKKKFNKNLYIQDY